jgi:hypothetical protein
LPISEEKFLAIWRDRILGVAVYGPYSDARPSPAAVRDLITDILGHMYDMLTEPGYQLPQGYIDTFAVMGTLARMLTDAEEQGYVPAGTFLDPERFPDFNAMRRMLAQHPTIRRKRPVSKRTGRAVANRLDVHAADWLKLAQTRRTTDALDQSADTVEAMVREVGQRKAEARRRRAAG